MNRETFFVGVGSTAGLLPVLATVLLVGCGGHRKHSDTEDPHPADGVSHVGSSDAHEHGGDDAPETDIDHHPRDPATDPCDLSNFRELAPDLRLCQLAGAEVAGENLRRVDLSDADLSGAILVNADLFMARLPRAYVAGADLDGAKLIGAELVGADLTGATLRGADLTGAKLLDATLAGALTDESTICVPGTAGPCW